MVGTLTVQNLQGPASGANANKVIIPSGHTLDASGGTLVPSAGQIINVERFSQGEGNIDISATTYTLAWSFNYTPVSSNSTVIFAHSLSLRPYGMGIADCRFDYAVNLNGSTYLANTQIGIYDYGSHGIWSNLSFSNSTEYANTSGANISWGLFLATHGAVSVRFNEQANSDVLVYEIAA